MSRWISQFFCNMNSSKNFTCPSGKLRTEFTSPTAKSTSPRLSDTTFFAHCSHTARGQEEESLLEGGFNASNMGHVQWTCRCCHHWHALLFKANKNWKACLHQEGEVDLLQKSCWELGSKRLQFFQILKIKQVWQLHCKSNTAHLCISSFLPSIFLTNNK